MRSSLRSGAVAAVSITLVATGAHAQQRPAVPGAIRSSVVLVPIDVRVVNGDGNPVTDLTEPDFTVFEDGVPQRIGHFSTQAFEALSAGALPAEPVLRSGPGLETSPLKRRTFLIVLGRGRLQYPARGIDAVRDFLKTGALPQDLVALQAYGRQTDFMTEREPLLTLLAAYEQHHEKLEALLNHWFQGPWRFDAEASPGIERKVQALFELPGVPPVRRLALSNLEGETEFERRRREARQAALWTHSDRAFDRDFVYDAAGRDDAEKLYGAIEYLRFYEGEKHILYVSEKGLLGGYAIDADAMAARAADARVSVSIVRTGGVETSWSRSGGSTVLNGPPAATFFANADARELAARTGGIASAYAYAADTIGKLERATRFQYLLGYYPANAKWNGEPRRIEVRVRRPGLTVLHRGSYFAREEIVPFDRRSFLTHSRITGASRYAVQLKDVAVDVKASAAETRAGWKVTARLSVDPATVAFESSDRHHLASLEVAVFVGSRNERQIGELRRRLDLKRDPSKPLDAAPLEFETALETSVEPRYVKVIVYDYMADKLGSAVVQISTSGRPTG